MKTSLFPSLTLMLAATSALAQTATIPPPSAQDAPNNVSAIPAQPAGQRLTLPLETRWLFQRVDVSAGDARAKWTTVSLPHDWAIAGPFSADATTKRGGAYLPAGVANYRKFFTLPAADAGQRVEIQFDGIQANGEVFINGHSLGLRPYGYVGVNYDLTPYLTFGPDKPNAIDVHVNNSLQPLSRYYTGSGIERHVRVVVTNPVYVATWGLYVTTKAVVGQSAVLHVLTEVTNSSNAAHTVTVTPAATGPDGQSAMISGPTGTALAPPPPQTIAAGQTATFAQDIADEGNFGGNREEIGEEAPGERSLAVELAGRRALQLFKLSFAPVALGIVAARLFPLEGFFRLGLL